MLLNPYQAPEISTHHAPERASKDAPLIWYAATVAGLWSVTIIVITARSSGLPDVMSIFFNSLILASPPAIAAVVIYAVLRHLFRQRFDYASTRWSLVLAGVVAVAYLSAIQHWDWQRPWNDYRAWLIGTLLAFPFGICVVAIERWGTRWVGKSTSREARSVRTQAAHASILWFSFAAFVLMFALSTVMDERKLGLWKTLVMNTHGSAAVSLALTAAYGLLSVCFARARPATRVSRFAAASVYVGGFCALAYILRDQNVARTTPLLVPLLFAGPAFLAVPADRWLARLTATSRDCNSSSDSSESVLTGND